MGSKKISAWILPCYLIVTCIFIAPASADPLEVWNWRNPTPCGPLKYVTQGNGVYVALGDGESVAVSPDGINWTVRTLNIAGKEPKGIVYANGLFVMIAGTNDLMSSVYTSADGFNWTEKASDNESWASGIAYGNGLFVAVARGLGGGIIFRSYDGINWTKTKVASQYFTHVVYGNGVFVGLYSARSGGNIYVSTDGITWDVANADTSTYYEFYSITYGNGMFVALSVGNRTRIITSADGRNWTAQYDLHYWRIDPYSLTYSNGLFLFLAEQKLIFTSTDAINWTIREWEDGPSPDTDDSVSFIAVGYDIVTSADGSVWTSRTKRLTIQRNESILNPEFRGIAYGNGIFVAVGTRGEIYTSTDGKNWTPQISGTYGFLRGIIYSKGTFIVVGGQGVLLFSSDAVNWTVKTLDTKAYFSGIAYGNGIFVAVGSSETWTSPDGENWSMTNYGHRLSSIVFGNGLFVAVGEHGAVFSQDGTSWSSAESAQAELSDVTFGKGLFVANGYNLILTSPNGIIWSDTGVREGYVSRVAFGNGVFIAGGYQKIFRSSDGVQWAEVTAPLTDFSAAAYGENTFVAVFTSGAILQSDPMNDPCTAMLSPDLKLSLPALAFNGNLFTAILNYESASDLWLVTSIEAVENPTSFAECQPATASFDGSLFRASVPAVSFGNIFYQGKLEQVPTPDGQLWFRANDILKL